MKNTMQINLNEETYNKIINLSKAEKDFLDKEIINNLESTIKTIETKRFENLQKIISEAASINKAEFYNYLIDCSKKYLTKKQK